MNSIKYLYAAYAATWIIHVFYLTTLVRRYSRLRQQLKELAKK
jgi:CcmD family protein